MIYLYEVHDLLILVYRRRLIWSKPNLAIYYEVEIVDSFLQILNCVFSKKGKVLPLKCRNFGLDDMILMLNSAS